METWDQPPDIIRVEGEGRRVVGAGATPAEGAGPREREAEAVVAGLALSNPAIKIVLTRSLRPDIADASAVAMATPADGPSFGIAPAGT